MTDKIRKDIDFLKVICKQLEDNYLDRKSVVQGKSVDLGGRRIIKKKKRKKKKEKKRKKKK